MSGPCTVAFEGFARDASDYSLKVIQELVLTELGFVEAESPEIVICTEDTVSLRRILENYPEHTIRILFNCELGSVDLNFFDYVIGWEEFDLAPRYARMHPAVRLEGSVFWPAKEQTFSEEDFEKREFCSFVASNGRAHPFRDEFFHRLNSERRVDSWGKHLNNYAPKQLPANFGSWEMEKISVESNYKFAFAIENGSCPGYTTEKVFSAVMAGAIPIYWGNPRIGEDINLQRIFSLHEHETVDSAIEALIALAGDCSALARMANQKLMSPEQEARVVQSKEAIRTLFLHASKTAQSGKVLRPTGTTTTVREFLFLRALRRDEQIAQRKELMANLIRRFIPSSLVVPLYKILDSWKKYLNGQSRRWP